MLYLDTNIFIYAADKNDPHHNSVTKFLHQTYSQKTPLITSSETLQEIVHTFKRNHKLKYGLKICQIVLKLVPHIIPVDKSVIAQFLKLVSKYPKIESRDCLHIATCIVYKLPTLVTEDKSLLKTRIPNLNINSPSKLSLHSN